MVTIVLGIICFILILIVVFGTVLTFMPNFDHRKKSNIIVLLLAIVLFFADFAYLDSFVSNFTPHLYVYGRDTVINQQQEVLPNGDTTTVVYSWYNPEHEEHMVLPNNEVAWQDLNGSWHKEKPVSADTIKWIVIAFQVMVIILTYKYMKRKEPKEKENLDMFNQPID